MPGRRAFRTDRTDRWWLYPSGVVVGLGVFIVYSLLAALVGNDFAVTAQGAHYLSPFYSPCLVGNVCGSFGFSVLSSLPAVAGYTVSAALVVLWAPLGLRASCYYYRKAYYRGFFADPPACAVSEPRNGYHGERRFWQIWNFHRYFLYAAIVVLVFIWYDTIQAFTWTTASGGTTFGVGVGSLVLLANAILLTGFTLGCHAFRHVVGGGKDCFSQHRVRHRLWRFSTWFNHEHEVWAWTSLFVVGFADLYVRLIAMGIIHVIRIF